MLRMHLVVLLGLSLVEVAHGDEVKPKTEPKPKPQWQRLLAEADARKADDVEKRIVALEAADNYAEAIRQREQLLALRTRLQGADHWETVNETWKLRIAKKVAALPQEKRAGWRKADKGAEAAGRLEQQAQHAKALTPRLERLKWSREILGENHPDTALSYNNVAYILYALGKHGEAEPLYRKALDIRRKVLGENHPNTALGYNNAAANLNAQGKYAEAGPLLQKALDIRRKVLGENHADTASTYNNVAVNLNAQGKYAEAEPLYQKALDIHRKILGENHLNTAIDYNNVAQNLNAQGKCAEAAPLYRKALDIFRKVLGENHPNTALGYNNVAANLNAQGKYAEAGPLLQKALDIHRKVLGENHPDTAESYNNVAGNLNAQGKYAEAAPLLQKALAIRRKVLGDNHLGMVSSYNNVAYNLQMLGKYAEAEPLYQKALDIHRKVLGENHPNTALAYNNVAVNLNAQGKYAEAGPLLQKALDIRRKVLGENHPDTASSYNNVAGNLNAQGKYAEAEPLYRKALDIHRKILGDNHPNTAIDYNNVATNLNAQGKYAEAGPLYQKALDIDRKVLGQDHPDTAQSYNNVAVNLNAQGKYAEAGQLLQKALDIRRKVLGENHPDTASSYNNVAVNLNAQGKYAEAGQLLQKALDIRRKALGENHPDTASSYNNVAQNLSAQGKYAEAGPLLRKALDIRCKVLGQDHPDIALSYNNVAANLNAQGKYAEAGPLYQKALDIYGKVLGENHPVTTVGYNNVAANLNAQGKYAEAVPLLQKALDIRRRVLGEDHPETAQNYNNVAYNLYALGKYPQALASSETAARSYEAARLSIAVTGLERAAFGAERSPYPFLAAARSRAGHAADAWAALEADLARGLLDDMARRRGRALTPAEQRQRDDLRARRTPLDRRVLAVVSRPQRLDADTAELARLVEQRRQLEMALASLAVLVSQREVALLAQLQAALPADAAFLAWVDVNDTSGGVQEHWGCVVRPKGDPHWERLPGSAAQGKWSREDATLPTRFREALAGSASAAALDALAKQLHTQRLAPLSKHLAGVKRLFVAPVNQMAGIPIEALTDQYTVSYTPSATYLARLKERPRPHSSGLLAVGDPVFPPTKGIPQPTALPPGGLLLTQVLAGGSAAKARLQAGDVLVAYDGEDLTSVQQFSKLLTAKVGAKAVVVKVWREGQDKLAERELAAGRLGVAVAKEPAREAITARRQADQLLAQLRRGDSYAELPGSQVEIARLAELFDPKSVTTLTRAAASEQRLDALRRAGTLTKYRYLHLATHGKANNVRAFESALMLTPPTRLPEVRVGEPYLEGRLTAGEVLEYWKLDAELVTLSACESGLGRQGGGDGLLGFAQSFLMAGSRSVCLTLWQVDDTATALFMDRFYRNLLGKGAGGKPLGKAAALREAKQWLRSVPASAALARLGTLTQGVVRGERPVRQEMKALPKPKDAAKDYRPYAHPRYWAAFILIGDPD